MAAVVVLEFEGIGKGEYDAVNAELGIDMDAGTGPWPDGLMSHVGAANDAGEFMVVEVWESPDAHATWMNGTLGPALGKVGVPAPIRVTWLDLIGYQTR
ncbi:MAG: hypothetical protein ACHQIG_13950 [Acidimicrobiia bacterium]